MGQVPRVRKCFRSEISLVKRFVWFRERETKSCSATILAKGFKEKNSDIHARKSTVGKERKAEAEPVSILRIQAW